MSDLRVNTISASNGTSPVTLTKQEASKHWISVTYSSGTPTNRDSLNVSGIVDTTGGECTVSFVSAFAAATDYCWTQGTLNTSASQEVITCYTKAASNYKTYNFNTGGAGGIDPEGFYVVSIGDLA